MPKTLDKHIRIEPEQWKRIEASARQRDMTANQLVVELAMEALDRSEWPRTALEILMVRSCLFSAQAMARDMIADGRQNEIKEIEKAISSLAPPLPEHL